MTAMAPMVISPAHGTTPAIGGLFDGLAFFILQRVPFRATYVQRIQANGGRVVKTEAQADHIIADHLRPDCPPGSISYTFIEAALKDGEIPDPANHHAGPAAGAVRDVGSVSVPPRSTRTPFTAAEDRLLWEWVERAKESGGSVKGNEIYKQLEQVNPRHSFQSWRDRYIKKLMDGPPPPGVDRRAPAATAPTNQPRDSTLAPVQSVQEEVQAETPKDARKRVRSESEAESELKEALNSVEVPDLSGARADSPFTVEEFREVLRNGPDIVKVDEQRTAEAWEAWAKSEPSHSADEWRAFWAEIVKPVFLETREKVANSKKRRGEESMTSDVSTMRRPKPSTQARSSPAANSASPKKQFGRRRLSESDFSHLFTAGDDSDEPKTPRTPAPGRQINPDAPIVLSSDEEAPDLEVVRPPAPNANDDDVKLDITSQVDGARDMPPFPTSGENDAADLQIRRESGDNPAPVSDMPQSELVTSDANRLAEQQLRLEADGPADFDSSQPKDGSIEDDVVISSHLVEDGEVEDGLPGEDLAEMDDNLPAYPDLQDQGVTMQIDDDQLPPSQKAVPQYDRASVRHFSGPMPSSQTAVPEEDGHRQSDDEGEDSGSSLLEEGVFPLNVDTVEGDAEGAPLTAANLASQQAQHKLPIIRGTDLPVDNEQHDQTNYANYLQSLMGYKQADELKSMSAAAVDEAEQAGKPRSAHLHLSPQQKIDDILEDTLGWPSSPRRRERAEGTRKVGEESGHFETQAVYPNLPSDLAGSRTGDRALVRPSKNVRGRDRGAPNKGGDRVLAQVEKEEVNGAQSQRPDEERTRRIATSKAEAFYDVLPRLESGRDLDENAGSQNDEQINGTHAVLSDSAAEDSEIDLVVPVPSGGFDLSSSPVRTGPAQLRQRLAGQWDGDQDDLAPRSDAIELHDSNQSVDQRTPIDISSGKPTSSPYESSEEDEISREGRDQVPAVQAFDTQDILNAETQQPDFDMPLPPDSDEEDDQALSVPQSSTITPIRNGNRSVPRSNTRRSTTLDQSFSVDPTGTQALEDDDDIDDFIATRSLRFSINEATIIHALKATSMRPALAELVMLEQKAGKGMPDDVPGIWSAEEDEIIEGGNAKRINMVSQKHGWTEVIRRMTFLRDWRETSD